MSKSRAIGTSAESAVVKVARASGFPFAERRALAGSEDQGDVRLDPRGRVVLEVKAGKAAETASDAQVEAWLVETERERVAAGAWYGFLILKRAGKGPRNADRWWAVGRLDDIAGLALFGDGRSTASSESITTRLHYGDLLTLLAPLYGEEP
jgi:hypothetical protein